MPKHIAVILVALGGPRSLEEVGPFMASFLGRPAPPPVVSLVTERYKLIGGKSPLPDIVKAQAEALAKELGEGYIGFEGFCHSRPTVADAFERAMAAGATRVIALSMSPFSTEVTTGAYRRACQALGTKETCPLFIPSWHDNPLFIQAWVEKITTGIERFSVHGHDRIAFLFTSHSIPIRYISAGDPYKRQIEETISLISGEAGIEHTYIAWQSKGAKATEPWLEPEVEPTLDRIAADGFKAVMVVPIGFTCDHMETLYDIDIVHKRHAENLGLAFGRVESLNTSPLFIKALADIVRRAA